MFIKKYKSWKINCIFCLTGLLMLAFTTSLGHSTEDYQTIFADPWVTVEKIEVTGNKNITKSAVEYYLGFEVGDQVTSLMLNKSMKTIRSLPAIKDLEFSFQDGVLQVTVEENPIIKRIKLFDFGKNAAIVRESLSIEEGEYFSAKTMRIAVKEILYAHNTMGFYLVNVEVDIEELENNQVNLNLRLRKGKRAEIAKIIFSGVNSFTHSELRKKVYSTEKRPLSWFFGSASFYREDVSVYDEFNIRKFYQDNGFPDAEVSAMFSEYDVRNNSIILTFVVSEGEKHLLGFSTISKNKISASLDKHLVLRPGTVYNKSKINQVAAHIENDLADLGYMFASVTASEVKRDNDNIVDIKYLIDLEGTRTKIAKINFSGNVKLNETYLRSIMPVLEGDLLTRKKYNLIHSRLGKLQSKGLLKSFTIDINSEENKQGSVINVRVEEGRSVQFSIGVNFAGGLPKFNLGVNAAGLFGGGRDFNTAIDVEGKDKLTFSISAIDETLIPQGYLSLSAIYQRHGLKKLYPALFQGAKLEENIGNDLTLRGRIGFTDGTDIRHNFGLTVGLRGSLLKSTIKYTEAMHGFGGAEKFELTGSYGIDYSFAAYYNLILFNVGANSSLSFSKRDHLPKAFYDRNKRNNIKNTTWGLDLKLGMNGSMTLVFNDKVYFRTSVEGGIIFVPGCGFGALCSVSQNRRYTLGDNSFPGFYKSGLGPRRVAWRKDGTDQENSAAEFGYGGNSYYLVKNSLHLPFIEPIGLRLKFFNILGAVMASDIHPKNQVVSSSAYPDYKPRASIGVSLEWNSPFGYLVFNFAKAVLKGPTDYPYFFSFQFGASL